MSRHRRRENRFLEEHRTLCPSSPSGRGRAGIEEQTSPQTGAVRNEPALDKGNGVPKGVETLVSILLVCEAQLHCNKKNEEPLFPAGKPPSPPCVAGSKTQKPARVSGFCIENA